MGKGGPSPSRLVASDVSLDGDGSFPQAQVLLSHQPPPDGLLDPDAGRSEFVGPYFFQISHLASPEEYLCLPKLVLILVLFPKETLSAPKKRDPP